MYILDIKMRENKTVWLELINIYGIGKYNSLIICKKLGFSKNFIINELTKKHLLSLKSLLNTEFKVLNELKTLKVSYIKRLIDIKCYRGLRRLKGLPIRGQRTHTNSRTARRYNKII